MSTSEENGWLFRLERAAGFREPEGFNAATSAFFVVVFLAALVLSVLAVMDAQTLDLTLGQLSQLGLFVAAVTQAARDFSYRTNRKLSDALRVVARLVVAPAALVMYVVSMYVVHGVWPALIVAGLICVFLLFALLLNRFSGPRRPRGPGPV